MSSPLRLKVALEDALERGLREVAAADEQWSALQRRRALEDQYNLSKGADCLYDRPGTGFAYASWYQLRRVRGLVDRLVPLVEEMPEHLTVLDIGAGTGATFWALAVARDLADALGPARIDVIEVDTSPSMAQASETLNRSLRTSCPQLVGGMTRRTVLRPWLEPPTGIDGAWLVAGHLFDFTDSSAEISQQFRRLLLRLQPERVLIDAPHRKLLQHKAAIDGAVEAGYDTTPPRRVHTVELDGLVPSLGELRRGVHLPLGTPPSMLRKPPTWSPPSVIAADLVPSGPLPSGQLSLTGIDLTLDDDQERLARPSASYEVIVGAAGSGKSLVLVERLARTITEGLRIGRDVNVLVTTRNVRMTDQLAMWTAQRLHQLETLDDTQRAPGDRCMAFVESDRSIRPAKVRFLNWHKIPTQLFGCTSVGVGDTDSIRARIEMRRRQGWQRLDEHPELTDVDWLAAELLRVIHAQRLRSREEYLATARTGRQKPLQQSVRGPVWDLLMETRRADGRPAQSSFTYLWMNLVDELAPVLDTGAAVDEPRFTHVFVDEVQDFTATDLRVVAAMVDDNVPMTLVGDSGQAMLLGTTFDVPGILRSRRRTVHTLDRSYRLGRRLAEAVQPLADAIVEATPQSQRRWVGVPSGTRSGVVGFRPVVLLRSDQTPGDLASVLRCFADVLRQPGEVRVTVAEGRKRDDDLLDVARNTVPSSVTCAHESMAAIKGLERTVVVWNTNSRWALDEGANELVHTVLTRATSLAVIVFDENGTTDEIRTALAHLHPERLLFWDADAETAWERLRVVAMEEVVDDPVAEQPPPSPDLLTLIDAAGGARDATYSATRFTRPDWVDVGETVARCPVAHGGNRSGLGGYRSPYESGGRTYHYWALYCSDCDHIYEPAELDPKARVALYVSSTLRPGPVT